MKREFLDLNRHPIANGFLTEDEFDTEYFFNLKVGFDEDTKLVSLMEFVDGDLMFNDSYIYHSSNSEVMRNHFRTTAANLQNIFRPKRTLEIGSNDGAFLKNFEPDKIVAIEPCGNFAKMTSDMGYETHNKFWDCDLANTLEPFDLIYAANCMCHIPDIQRAFSAVKDALSPGGVFVFEDPTVSAMISRNSYDQIYDEHAHIFSVMALKNLLENVGMEIFNVEQLNVHGGSNRIYAKIKHDTSFSHHSIKVDVRISQEISMGLHGVETYMNFAKKVAKSKEVLVKVLDNYKSNGKKIVSYGGTSKSTTVFNYCGIGPDIIDYITDTTPDKQGKYSPGMHIPVVSPDNFDESVDVAFLGAWNFEEYILNKEKSFINRGGKFISHVPEIRIING